MCAAGPDDSIVRASARAVNGRTRLAKGTPVVAIRCYGRGKVLYGSSAIGLTAFQPRQVAYAHLRAWCSSGEPRVVGKQGSGLTQCPIPR